MVSGNEMKTQTKTVAVGEKDCRRIGNFAVIIHCKTLTLSLEALYCASLLDDRWLVTVL